MSVEKPHETGDLNWRARSSCSLVAIPALRAWKGWTRLPDRLSRQYAVGIPVGHTSENLLVGGAAP